MKKFTLLMGLALVAGSAMAQETIQGIKITPEDAAPEARYYYSISNMRIQRLNYTTGFVAGYDREADELLWEEGEEYMIDGGVTQVPLPLFLPDGYPVDWEEGTSVLEDFEPGDYKLTPQPYQYPYMGLAEVDGKFWLAFSAQSEVMDPNTTYWYFTKGSSGSRVNIHNAVIDGTVKRTSELVLGRKATGFDTNENNYYVLNVKDQLIDLFGDPADEEGMALNEAQMNAAFALSTGATVKEEGDNCLDVNNYITYNYVANRKNADGSDYLEIVEEEDEEGEIIEVEKPVELKYGFASVDRTWSPLRQNGSNDNHMYNNGSLFFVNEQPTQDALDAIEAYRDVVIAAYRKGAIEGAKNAYLGVVSTLKGWANVPALWKDASYLNALIAECEAYAGGDAANVVDLASQEEYIAQAQAAANRKLVDAAKQVGQGAVVTFMNKTPLRNIEDTDDDEIVEEYQLGDAYIAAGVPGWCNDGGMTEVDYDGIGASLEKTANCEWELIPVWNTTSFYLYNAATKSYIRQYTNMFELAGGLVDEETGERTDDGEITANAGQFTWATTTDVKEAAAFTFEGCADVENQKALSEAELELVEVYEVDTDVVNNVVLRSSYTETVVDEETGETSKNTVNTYIHRASGNYDYQFINYWPENNRWYADSNIFTVGVVTEGGIDEIVAESNKNVGIYDLQGRKVAKASKGLYIINGVKTIVR